jgi:hypothetical protein
MTDAMSAFATCHRKQDPAQLKQQFLQNVHTGVIQLVESSNFSNNGRHSFDCPTPGTDTLCPVVLVSFQLIPDEAILVTGNPYKASGLYDCI